MSSISKLLLALTLIAVPSVAASVAHATSTVQGTVSSGGGSNKTAIAGAQVKVYQVQPNGPTLLAAGTSNSSGNFNLAVTVDASGGALYAVARKGNIELMTIIGTGISGSIVINEMTTVASAYALAQIFHTGAVLAAPLPLLPVEVAAGMAENLVSAATGMPSKVITTSPNANETNAWRSLGTLANILAACVRNSGTACSRLFTLTKPPALSKPTTTLQAMVSIARHPATNVKPIFALGEAVKVFTPNLVAAKHGPNAPDKFLRLDAFTLAVKFNATGRVDSNGDELCPFGGLGNVVFDAKGYAWISNNVVQGTPESAHCQVVLKPNGHPADGTDNTPNSPLLGGGLLGQGFGIGIDPSGNVWSGNFGWGGVNPTDANGDPAGSVSKFTGSGEPLSAPTGITSNLYRVQGTVSDRNGNIWMASYGNSRVQVFPNGNPTPYPFLQKQSFPYYQDANQEPFDIRLDKDGFGWVTYTKSSKVSKFKLTKEKLVRQFTLPIGSDANPKGMTVDSKGNAWVTAGKENAIYAFDKNGKSLGVFKGGGIIGPWGAVTDSDDIVWVANFGGDVQTTLKYNVSKLCGANTAKCPAGLKLGDPITGSTGYTLPSGGDEVLLHSGKPLLYPLPVKSYKPLMRLTAVRADMAGNLWVMNNWKPSGLNDLLLNPGGDGVVIFVGLAAPVMPLLYSAPSTSPFEAAQ